MLRTRTPASCKASQYPWGALWLVAVVVASGTAHADVEPEPVARPIVVPEPSSTQPSAPQSQEAADEELRKMAEAQIADTVIEVVGERPPKIFDRDTDVRLTGAQLAARGATDLASALALLPDVSVREAGRGGFNIDVRGARKGSVSIFIDGVKVSDPFYGTFDVSTIPITDIV
ncbi:MAG: TonB-dependent receptor plug domain-containing protein, partial [Deltaproteobacteria bacterium]|nr:TonB-dependent receptor plug domain-containing protein [Deltaproteobacteria bacterium]